MAFTQGVIGGLAAGQRFAESAGASEARRQRQISEQQQARKQEVQTAIDDVAKTAKELNEQFELPAYGLAVVRISASASVLQICLRLLQTADQQPIHLLHLV